MNDFIPFLGALFENLNYLEVLADCMTRLISPSPGESVCSALLKATRCQFANLAERSGFESLEITALKAVP